MYKDVYEKQKQWLICNEKNQKTVRKTTFLLEFKEDYLFLKFFNTYKKLHKLKILLNSSAIFRNFW